MPVGLHILKKRERHFSESEEISRKNLEEERGKQRRKKNKEKSKERRKVDFSKELNSCFEKLIQCVILQLITTMGR